MAKQAYVYSGTDWVPLASEVTNLSGYYTKGEIDALPFGRVLQVVQGSTTTNTTIATTSFTDTTLTASITPSATSSQILIIFAQPFAYTRTASENGVGIQLLRDATSIYDISGGGGYTNRLQISGMTYFNFNDVVTGVYLDSPSSTSALTYKTQARIENAANAGSSGFNISRATITLMEIKG
jgi:hypothetical protein